MAKMFQQVFIDNHPTMPNMLISQWLSYLGRIYSRWRMWMPFLGGLCGGLCGWHMLVAYAGGLCRWLMLVAYVGGLCRWHMQVAYVVGQVASTADFVAIDGACQKDKTMAKVPHSHKKYLIYAKRRILLYERSLSRFFHLFSSIYLVTKSLI